MRFQTIPEKSVIMLDAEICTVLWSLVYNKFQIWLVLEISVIKLSDIPYVTSGSNLLLRSIQSFSVFIATILSPSLSPLCLKLAPSNLSRA